MSEEKKEEKQEEKQETGDLYTVFISQNKNKEIKSTADGKDDVDIYSAVLEQKRENINSSNEIKTMSNWNMLDSLYYNILKISGAKSGYSTGTLGGWLRGSANSLAEKFLKDPTANKITGHIGTAANIALGAISAFNDKQIDTRVSPLAFGGSVEAWLQSALDMTILASNTLISSGASDVWNSINEILILESKPGLPIRTTNQERQLISVDNYDGWYSELESLSKSQNEQLSSINGFASDPVRFIGGLMFPGKGNDSNGRTGSWPYYPGAMGRNYDYNNKLNLGPVQFSYNIEGRAKSINDIENEIRKERFLGQLYIEPFTFEKYYWNNNINKSITETIEFEFNPSITEQQATAEYRPEDVMGRLLKIQGYTSSNSPDVTIKTKYIALCGKDTNKSGWEQTWTDDKLKEIEKKYRSLVLPIIDIENETFIRPPIIRIQLNENPQVSDLFKYPVTVGSDEEKRYVARSVQITPLTSEDYTRYKYKNEENGEFVLRGFEVSLNLVPTTKSFLDRMPSFKNYYGEQ